MSTNPPTIHPVKVPDVGEGIAEVELVAWAVAEGQAVSRNQPLAEVMTEKANVEIPCPVDATVGALSWAPGDRLAVGEVLVELVVAEGAAAPAPSPAPAGPSSGASPGPARASSVGPSAGGPLPVAAPAGQGEPATVVGVAPFAGPVAPTRSASRSPAPAGRPAPAPAGSAPAAGQPRPRPDGERPRATPAVRARARQAGIDLGALAGTGPGSRITHHDLDAALAGGPASGPPPVRGPGPAPAPAQARTSTPASPGPGAGPPAPASEEPLIGLRRHIAQRMVAATTSIPHITYVDEVDVTALEELRATLNQRRSPEAARLTLLPFLVRALVVTLPRFPTMNAHLDDTNGVAEAVLRRFDEVSVGIATQTPNGLVVPVVHQAGAHSLWSLAARIGELAEAARDGRAALDELRGSTITITSLGALGGLVTTPVINKPETTIVGVNKIATRPVWDGHQFVPRQMMNLSSSFDHRVIDGWDAALFVQELRTLLEQPALLFVDGAGAA